MYYGIGYINYIHYYVYPASGYSEILGPYIYRRRPIAKHMILEASQHHIEDMGKIYP
jgi:hypothetical protein